MLEEKVGEYKKQPWPSTEEKEMEFKKHHQYQQALLKEKERKFKQQNWPSTEEKEMEFKKHQQRLDEIAYQNF